MSYSVDQVTAYLAVAIVLLLSILTIESCRRDKSFFFRDLPSYLFRGKSQWHALASNVGMVFSVTYFFGAIVIYSQIFASWYMIPLLIAVAVSLWIHRRLLRICGEELSAGELADQKSNIVLALLCNRLPGPSFKALSSLYLLIYFALLVEELAVSRLVLSVLLPRSPVVTTLILATIYFVITTYIFIGGFRAVLSSDLVQVPVLLAFLGMIIYMSWRIEGQVNLVELEVQESPSLIAANLLLVGIMAVAWFVAGIDFYSRLNFSLGRLGPGTLMRARKFVVAVSLFATLLILGAGIVFGQSLAKILPRLESCSHYTSFVVQYFVHSPSRIIAVVFLVSLYCMIFTTIDNLAMTVLQIGSFAHPSKVSRQNIAPIMFVAILLSTFIKGDWVSTVGIFAGSLLVLPLSVITGIIWPNRFFSLMFSPRALGFSAALSVILFMFTFPSAVSSFSLQFLLPGIPVASLAITGLIVGAVLMHQKEGSDGKT